MRYSHVVFDIDGTLINSEKAVLKSFQETLITEVGIEKELDELKFALGIPGKDALKILNIESREDILEKWDNNYNKYLNEVTLFDGIRQVIQELKSNNINLGIITSKTRKEYEGDFIRFGLDSYFDVVIRADDTIKHKPDGEPMEKYLELADARREDTVYIGDSIYDMQCAKNAGVDSILALWGANDADKLTATYKLSNPKEILDLLIVKKESNMKWLDWAVELQQLAQIGLTYSKDPYDLERFERIREISAEIVSEKSELNLEKVKDLFCNETGFQTPKLDTRAAIFKENKILLVKETESGKWSLPGGWVDVNQSIYSNTAKEVKEEAGLDVIPDRIIAVQDRNKHNTPRYAYGICKVFVLCNLVGGEFKPNIETSESRYFALGELPKLAEEKNNEEQIRMCFLAAEDENWKTIFD